MGVVEKEGKTKVNISSVKLDHFMKVWAKFKGFKSQQVLFIKKFVTRECEISSKR